MLFLTVINLFFSSFPNFPSFPSSSLSSSSSSSSGHRPSLSKKQKTFSAAQITPRTFHEWKVFQNFNGQWCAAAIIAGVQQIAGQFENEEYAQRCKKVLCPPVWDEKSTDCHICHKQFTLVLSLSFGTRHHCRNCGVLVCSDCSTHTWPSTMFPPLFKCSGQNIRVCDYCQFAVESFRTALLDGNLEEAKIWSNCNVNIGRPFSFYPDQFYPIHCAVKSNSLALVRWLVEEEGVPLSNGSRPVLTKSGKSALCIALEEKSNELIYYLIARCKCSTKECSNIGHLQESFDKFVHGSYNVFEKQRTRINELEQQIGCVVSAQPISSSSSLRTFGNEMTVSEQDDDKDLCVICMNAPISCVLVPCGHYCLCEACSASLPSKRCPVCRGEITQTVKAFVI
eukprot:c21320_g1_i2.p1 GENE.c21320_g1_i2~~c21320_g1_i2.p1  ORF type:complete len:396 (-),score=130.75 c21320_g1_i2:62-1249(-)